MHNTSNNTHNTRPGHPNLRGLFDMGSILYSVIPRTVIIDPNNTGLRGSAQNSGLSIQQVEENTEIINYDSIPTNEILNTECPISISPFTSNSVVLRLKRCRHCFVPFRMMVWLETHSTCPLCRLSVVEPATGTGTGDENVPQTATNNTNTLPSTSPEITNMLNSIRTNILNSFNNSTAASTATPTPTNVANNATQLLNQLSNLSIDDVNDNSIMFSFDMPANSTTHGSSVNNLNDLSNSYIIPQLYQLFTNTLGGGASSIPPRSNNNETNDDNNDENNDDNNDRMDLD